MRQAIFYMLWLFIAVVSAFDTYLTVEYSEWLVGLERNPVALWLISLAGSVSLLVALKFFGTSLVLGYLAIIRNRWFAMPVVSGVAAVQCALLGYLVLR